MNSGKTPAVEIERKKEGLKRKPKNANEKRPGNGLPRAVRQNPRTKPSRNAATTQDLVVHRARTIWGLVAQRDLTRLL